MMKKELLKDHSAKIEDLKEEVRVFCTERDWDEPHNPKDLAIGIVTEASELLEIFRFYPEKESLEMVKNKEIRIKVGEELADVLCFILRFAQLYKLDLTTCLGDKLKKNAIKYPLSKEK